MRVGLCRKKGRSRGSVLALSLSSALCAGACAKTPVRPGRLGDCGDASKSCVTVPPISRTPTDAGGDGSAGAGGASDAASEAGVALTGTVALLQNDTFSSAAPFTDPAEIRAEGANGSEVTASYDGTHPFQISGVRAGPSVWISASPTSSTSDALPTLQPVDTTGTRDVGLDLVSGSVLDTIYGILTQPVTRDPTAGQVVLRFVDSSGAPVANVAITQHPGGSVAYDAGASWSDTALGTGQLGLAVIANTQTGPVEQVEFAVGTASTNTQTATLQVEAGSVTFSSVVVQP